MPKKDSNRAPDPAGTVNSIGRLLNLAAKEARTYLDQRLSLAGAGFTTWTSLSILTMVGPMSQREMAERLSIEGPTLTHQLARMERQGLIVRERSTTDRRVTLVDLTPAGRELHQRLAQTVHTGHCAIMEGFSDKEAELFRTFLVRMQQNCTDAQAALRHDVAEDAS